ncbi:phosphate signaling complex protein PhoU [Saccharopolyspora indica]|uniref:phosphate signaling complex protein PhoU n=1 Tax=Saccharopolyspora indica TaxID=1229659 RepID=UPI0022EA1CE2|nr:phosphate signaling complex protein PhoU [Saccharopolyspora indica]MDA3648125.1 phosphate signaling complex protein PhoU [Saccharopolyspora indica]
MRNEYHHELDALVHRLAGMCDSVGSAMQNATAALCGTDPARADWVLAHEWVIDDTRRRIEEDVQQLLARQAPVATDLRVLVAALYAAESVERMGDLAQHIATAVRRRYPEPVLPVLLRGRFRDMGGIAVRLAAAAGELVRNRDLDDVQAMIARDDEVDRLHRSLFPVLSDAEWDYGVATAVDVTLLSRYYERFADHAVSVARRMAYVVTGELPQHA